MRFGKDKILALLDAGGVGADGAPVPYAEPFEPVAAKDSEAGTVLSLLKEYGVVTVPGESFGSQGTGYLRISYASSMEDLIEAGNKFEQFAQTYKK